MNNKLEILVGPFLFEFPTYQDHCLYAQEYYQKAGKGWYGVLAIDTKGRICTNAKEVRRAMKENCFPLKCYARSTQEN